MQYLHKQDGGLPRDSNSAKFFIQTCSPQWVRVQKEIKKVRSDRDLDIQKSQLLEGTYKDASVVIKIGDTLDIDNEYAISQRINKYKGFVKFICHFTCDDDFRDFFNGKRTSICKGPGDSMKVIIMPHFDLGSVAGFAWTNTNVHILRSCLYVACMCYIDVYNACGFIHNDFHSANVLLKPTKQTILKFTSGNNHIDVQLHGMRPWIMDFEKSTIMPHSAKGYQDLRFDMAKMFFTLPTFNKNITNASVLNVVSFIQNAADICTYNACKQLQDIINTNIQV